MIVILQKFQERMCNSVEQNLQKIEILSSHGQATTFYQQFNQSLSDRIRNWSYLHRGSHLSPEEVSLINYHEYLRSALFTFETPHPAIYFSSSFDIVSKYIDDLEVDFTHPHRLLPLTDFLRKLAYCLAVFAYHAFPDKDRKLKAYVHLPRLMDELLHENSNLKKEFKL